MDKVTKGVIGYGLKQALLSQVVRRRDYKPDELNISWKGSWVVKCA